MLKRTILLICVVVFSGSQLPVTAAAESLPSLMMLNLFYTGMKGRVDDEAVRKQIEEVDKALWTTFRSGRMGEIRRLLAQGMSLASGDGWSDRQDFDASLVARADTAFIDPSQPVMVRLSQIFPSKLSGNTRTVVHIALHEQARWARGGEQIGKKLEEYEKVADVGLDLIESPMAAQIDFAGIADGDYDLRLEVFDGEASLGSASARLRIRKGLANRISRLRQIAEGAPDHLKADILYPLDYMRKVDAGLVPIRGFDINAELGAAEEVASEVKAGKDPFVNRTGDFERHYLLADAGEIMPYRVFIPEDYPKQGTYPLVVALHGLGANEDSMFADWYGLLDQAGARGYIVTAPMGYRVDGGYGGFSPGSPPSRRARLSEQDVMEVLKRAQADYAVDPKRIYLMGHSMGGYGTWRLAVRYPEVWAALAPIAGGGNPQSAETIAHIPQIVVHGDADGTVPVANSRRMVDALEKLDAEVTYIEVPGGGHGDIAPANMGAIFDFFDKHQGP